MYENLIKSIDEQGNFITFEDGFVYFWATNGGLQSDHLRAIADELDRRNADWHKTINEYFDEHPPIKTSCNGEDWDDFIVALPEV